MTIDEDFFASHTLASKAAAFHVASAIGSDLSNSNEAAVVLSGGSTSKQCYDELASTNLRWDDVHVVLSDERCVPVDHQASNEGMIRRSLMINRAKSAKFVSANDATLSPMGRCRALTDKINLLPLPFSAVLLGMGADGHFASLFSEFKHLEDALDLDGTHRCMLVCSTASEQARMTLTMSSLTRAKEILLPFFGHAKRKTYERAKLQDSCLPVSRLLQQQRVPVRVFWAL